MSIVKKNIAANYIGSIFQAIINIVSVPVYIKFLGIESYGMVGVFASLQAIFVIFDMGISATLMRETARLSVKPDSKQEMRNTVRSLEIIYWVLAILIGTITILLAPLIANHWIKASNLTPGMIELTVRIMGVAIAFQWVASFYSGGLYGLQKQIQVNVEYICVNLVRVSGIILVLWLVSPSIKAFFLCQAGVNIVNVVILALMFWRNIPRTGQKAVFELSLIAGALKFAVRLNGIAMIAVILSQLDRIILSKMLPLNVFGYYTLAGTVAASICFFRGPVFSAVYPRFVQLYSSNDDEKLKQIYHKSCQLMSVALIPATVVIAMFSHDILLLWTHDPAIAQNSALVLSILISGVALDGLWNLPYALQLANGWTRLAFYANLLMLIFFVPLILFMTNYYGVVGSASAKLILNAAYLLFTVDIMHRRLLPGEKWNWYLKDIGMPLAASLIIVSIAKTVEINEFSRPLVFIYLFLVSFLTLSAAALATPTTRHWIFNKLFSIKNHILEKYMVRLKTKTGLN